MISLHMFEVVLSEANDVRRGGCSVRYGERTPVSGVELEDNWELTGKMSKLWERDTLCAFMRQEIIVIMGV